ncbi:MAG: ferritin family protein [bacterium]
MADIFQKTADQEAEHASRFFKMIQQLEEKS